MCDVCVCHPVSDPGVYIYTCVRIFLNLEFLLRDMFLLYIPVIESKSLQCDPNPVATIVLFVNCINFRNISFNLEDLMYFILFARLSVINKIQTQHSQMADGFCVFCAFFEPLNVHFSSSSLGISDFSKRRRVVDRQ